MYFYMLSWNPIQRNETGSSDHLKDIKQTRLDSEEASIIKYLFSCLLLWVADTTLPPPRRVCCNTICKSFFMMTISHDHLGITKTKARCHYGTVKSLRNWFSWQTPTTFQHHFVPCVCVSPATQVWVHRTWSEWNIRPFLQHSHYKRFCHISIRLLTVYILTNTQPWYHTVFQNGLLHIATTFYYHFSFQNSHPSSHQQCRLKIKLQLTFTHKCLMQCCVWGVC